MGVWAGNIISHWKVHRKSDSKLARTHTEASNFQFIAVSIARSEGHKEEKCLPKYSQLKILNYSSSFCKAVIAKSAGTIYHSRVENLGKELLPFITLQSVMPWVAMGSQMPEKMTRVTINVNLLCCFMLHFFSISFPNWQRLNLRHFETPEEGEIPWGMSWLNKSTNKQTSL